MKALKKALENVPDEFTFELIKIQDNTILKIHNKINFYRAFILLSLLLITTQYYNTLYIFDISLTWIYTVCLITGAVLLRYAWVDYLFNRAMRKALNNEVYGLKLT